MKQIFDIFSKPQKSHAKEKKKEKVIMDYREKNSLVYSQLENLGLEVEVRKLKVADYIANDVAVERKTVSDFISSMISKRLIRQLEEIQQYRNRILIIEGIDEQELYSDERYLDGGMHPNAIRGFLLSILIKYKTPVLFTKNAEDTARFISVLARRKEKEASLNVSKKTFDKNERMQFILEGFPGIGPKTAKKLLAHFGSIKEIINAPQEELEKAVGKKAEAMSKIINDRYRAR